jgi:hypothetical protein
LDCPGCGLAVVKSGLDWHSVDKQSLQMIAKRQSLDLKLSDLTHQAVRTGCHADYPSSSVNDLFAGIRLNLDSPLQIKQCPEEKTFPKIRLQHKHVRFDKVKLNIAYIDEKKTSRERKGADGKCKEQLSLAVVWILQGGTKLF